MLAELLLLPVIMTKVMVFTGIHIEYYPMTTPATDSCCPAFSPDRWDGQEQHWDRKPFLRASMATCFHIPLPWLIGKKVRRLNETATAAKRLPDAQEEVLLLFHDPSAFRSEILLSLTEPMEDPAFTTLSGTFRSRVFDGSYNLVPKFIKTMEGELAATGRVAKGFYIHYAYCPKCAQKFGRNRMILFAQTA